MRYGLFLVAALLASACHARTAKEAKPLTTQAQSSALPADIVAFRTKRDLCDHFRGEDPYDAARAAEIGREVTANCTGTDAALAALRRRHRGDARAEAALAAYEDSVE